MQDMGQRFASIRDTIIRAAIDFEAYGLASPRLDAEVILAHILKTDRLYLYRHPDAILTEEDRSAFQSLAARRCQGEPVAYLRGSKEFWSLDFEVNKQVLIPRPDTECLVEEVLKVCSSDPSAKLRILDLGTGSGAIGIVLALELPQAHVVVTDLSPAAIAVARRNAELHCAERLMTFLTGNLFEPLSGKFDMIVSNPPYISEAAFQELPAGVREYEPISALLAGPEGTVFYEQIIAGCAEYLQEGGWLFLEIGSEQRERVESLLAVAGFLENICFRRDYNGLDRVAMARKRK